MKFFFKKLTISLIVSILLVAFTASTYAQGGGEPVKDEITEKVLKEPPSFDRVKEPTPAKKVKNLFKESKVGNSTGVYKSVLSRGNSSVGVRVDKASRPGLKNGFENGKSGVGAGIMFRFEFK